MSEGTNNPSPQSSEPPQESNPDFKQKLKTFLKAIGFILLLFFVLLILQDKMKKKVPEAEKAPEQQVNDDQENTPSSVTERTYQEITSARQEADDSTAVVVVEEVQKATESFKEALKPDVLKQEMERHQSLEYKRASLASRSSWGLTDKGLGNSVKRPTEVAQVASESLATPDDLLSTDQQRLMIANRLKKMEELKQKIKSGNYSPGENKRAQNNISSIESSFSSPPSDVVGYTLENSYNASTEGMEKLPIGTIIPAISIMKASSDRTGTFKGYVSQDIYDVDYEYVLVPKGSELVFQSFRMTTANDALNSYVGYSVPWLILPNGNKVDLSKSSGVDREGLSGLSDQVDRHLLAQFMGVAAYALVANNSSYEGSGANSDSSYSLEVSEGLREQLAPEAQKYLQLRPTNIIRTGQSMNVIIEDEIFLKPWKNVYEDYL
ncbi:TrbI/VirB10 family protein [Vibrio coralliilyticus]|uniref:TrbI/VirB10 family protein n=1 Tax=Vibrio coralliilyticus TaxID=190893 RepID=UPI000C16AEC6|nr:TrbI/VirB10 family protein [Vibrio coralliilyticus]